MLAALRKPGRWLFGRASSVLEPGFGNRLNPLHYLGALTIFFFWIVLVSGIWLFIFFQTSVDGAYASVERLTHDQWYFGGVMRSLHRYASDAAVVTLTLHILREWVSDRHRGKHWFSWITGIPLLWIIVPLGICFIIRRVGTLEPLHIWIAIMVGHGTRCALSMWRFRQGKWRDIRVDIDMHPTRAEASAAAGEAV